ncbi:MAG: hypothetical protein LBH16_08530 [Treponema sp.]|jgi:outer membrane protein assembly factor BamD (BamD/ComL family)|nr:hypothetical protein [Treponema sp.]
MNKKEYIKYLKQLIKKYHPDLCNNSYLESMYNEITKILVNKLNAIKTVKNNEQDYLYYKSGIKYYKNIHPDKFYKRNQNTAFETRSHNELISALNKIYLSFNISLYYFNKIIDEYPQSSYFQDAKEKIKLLKKLYKSYENIILEGNKIVNNEKYMNEMELKIL